MANTKDNKNKINIGTKQTDPCNIQDKQNKNRKGNV